MRKPSDKNIAVVGSSYRKGRYAASSQVERTRHMILSPGCLRCTSIGEEQFALGLREGSKDTKFQEGDKDMAVIQTGGRKAQERAFVQRVIDQHLKGFQRNQDGLTRSQGSDQYDCLKVGKCHYPVPQCVNGERNGREHQEGSTEIECPTQDSEVIGVVGEEVIKKNDENPTISVDQTPRQGTQQVDHQLSMSHTLLTRGDRGLWGEGKDRSRDRPEHKTTPHQGMMRGVRSAHFHHLGLANLSEVYVPSKRHLSSQLKQLFMQADQDFSGEIELTEFVRLMRLVKERAQASPSSGQDSVLDMLLPLVDVDDVRLYTLLDTNNDGRLSFVELESGVNTVLNLISEENMTYVLKLKRDARRKRVGKEGQVDDAEIRTQPPLARQELSYFLPFLPPSATQRQKVKARRTCLH